MDHFWNWFEGILGAILGCPMIIGCKNVPKELMQKFYKKNFSVVVLVGTGQQGFGLEHPSGREGRRKKNFILCL